MGWSLEAALHLVLLPEAPPVHLLHLQRLQIDPVDRPHVDGQFPRHERHRADRVVERVGDLDAAGGAEGVFGCFCAEAVDGQVGAAVVELDVLFERVDPEFGVLWFFLGGFWVSGKEMMLKLLGGGGGARGGIPGSKCCNCRTRVRGPRAVCSGDQM